MCVKKKKERKKGTQKARKRKKEKKKKLPARTDKRYLSNKEKVDKESFAKTRDTTDLSIHLSVSLSIYISRYISIECMGRQV